MATAQNVIDRVRQLINDTPGFIAGVRWTDAEIMQWITDAQREIVELKPEANPVTEAFTVTGGSPRQRLDPTRSFRLIRVEANGSGSADEGDGDGDAVFLALTTGLNEGSGYLRDVFGTLTGDINEMLPTSQTLTIDQFMAGTSDASLVMIGSAEDPLQSVFTSLQVNDASGNPIATLLSADATYETFDGDFYASWSWTGIPGLWPAVMGTQRQLIFTV